MASSKLAIVPSAIILFWSLVACNLIAPSREITVKFENAKGLKARAPVELNGVVIGKVAAIEPGARSATFRLHIDQKKSESVQENAAALIVVENGVARISIFNPANPGNPISEGSELRGLNSKFELIAWQAEQAASVLRDAFKHGSTAMENYFRSEQWRKTKKEMRALQESLPEETESTIKHFRSEFDAFIDEMESESEQGLEEIQRQFDALSSDLEKNKREFLDKGHKEIAAMIDKLLQSLRATLDSYRYHHREQENPVDTHSL